jgi:hypothetical protein
MTPVQRIELLMKENAKLSKEVKQLIKEIETKLKAKLEASSV